MDLPKREIITKSMNISKFLAKPRKIANIAFTTKQTVMEKQVNYN
jgi:hypothetical protein